MKGFIFAALALALAAPAVQAAPTVLSADGRPVALTVRHDDIDLTTPSGARLMINRLDEAAVAVCGGKSFAALEYKRSIRSTACYVDSMNRAVAALGSPAVTGLHRERSPTVAAN